MKKDCSRNCTSDRTDVRTLGECAGNRKVLIRTRAMEKTLEAPRQGRHQGSAPVPCILRRSATLYQLIVHKRPTGRDAVGAVLYRGVTGAEGTSAECNRLRGGAPARVQRPDNSSQINGLTTHRACDDRIATIAGYRQAAVLRR